MIRTKLHNKFNKSPTSVNWQITKKHKKMCKNFEKCKKQQYFNN